MTEKSADLQWERSDQNACWTSERVHRRVYYHSSLLEYRFTVWSIKPVMNTLLHDLNVEIGMTTESRVYRTLSWWHERSVWWHVESVGDTWNSSGDTWRPRPRPSPSFYPVNLGRQSLRSGVTTRLQSRLLSWQTTDLPEGQVIEAHLLLLFVLFCNSLVILISSVSSSNFRCLFSLNLSHNMSSSCK